MTNGQTNSEHKLGARIANMVVIVSFSFYVVNMLIGKAIIVYEWDIFHRGDIGEFLIMFVASIAFIAVALTLFIESMGNINPRVN